jgi:hypothetical protein
MIAPVHLVELDGEFTDMRARLAKELPPAPLPRTPSKAPQQELPLPDVALRARAVQIALADPLKEFSRKVYDFSVLQLWGPSEHRNAPDRRFERRQPQHNVSANRCAHCGLASVDAQPGVPCVTYLTPREALQQLGTEWGRRMWGDTWIAMALRRASGFLNGIRVKKPGADAHTFAPNWIIERHDVVVVSDVRFVNEVRAIREIGGEVWRIERPNAGLGGDFGKHLSETEQEDPQITEMLTATIDNSSTLEALRAIVDFALREAGV